MDSIYAVANNVKVTRGLILTIRVNSITSPGSKTTVNPFEPIIIPGKLTDPLATTGYLVDQEGNLALPLIGNAFHVLIAILERIYHRSYESLVTAYLQGQLRMRSTKNDLSASESKRLVQGYDHQRHERLHVNNPQTMTGGPGLNSTLHDLMLYMQANLAETNGAFKLTHQLTWGQPDGFGMGMAWMMNTKCSGARYLYHSGRSRGCNSLCSFYPSKNTGIVILVNETINQGHLFVLEDILSQTLEKEL